MRIAACQRSSLSHNKTTNHSSAWYQSAKPGRGAWPLEDGLRCVASSRSVVHHVGNNDGTRGM
eukprot:3409928-Rhodomonas_salina.4